MTCSASTHSHDRSGRRWARLSELKAGDVVTLDGGFTCAPAGPVTIEMDSAGLFFRCRQGVHDLRGQADDGEHLVGIYPPATADEAA